ncbi:MAG TPA: universal stress protein [Gaiellaceae bacterium]|jgi:nucleotide-binding universal stress UspA family protein
MKRIVVGFDGSEHGRKALERAVELAGDGTQVAVVVSAEVSTLKKGATSAIDPAEAEARAEALDDARSALGAQDVDAVFVEGVGHPADVIVQEAEESGADLVVVGTRGLNAAKRLVMGSVSTNVVHNAPCDVLVVR